MTTRSGRNFSIICETTDSSPATGMADGGEAQAESASTDVTVLLQMLVDDRQCREQEFADERARQTVEMERRVEEMRAQVDNVQADRKQCEE